MWSHVHTNTSGSQGANLNVLFAWWIWLLTLIKASALISIIAWFVTLGTVMGGFYLFDYLSNRNNNSYYNSMINWDNVKQVLQIELNRWFIFLLFWYIDIYSYYALVGTQLYLVCMFPWRKNNWVLEHIIKLAAVPVKM